jgi:hypothetical protein
MSQVILHVLCEGQTEDRFAGEVLKEHLQDFNIVVKTTILLTNKKKNVRGGILSYQQAKRDLELLIKQYSKKSYEIHFFTTMFDLYALPDDFPGHKDAEKISDCYDKIKTIEDKFDGDIACNSFIPYIQLHEFEALVFCGLEHLLIDYPDMEKQINNLKEVVKNFKENTEKINNSPETAPSKRIIKEFNGFHSYDKPKSGLSVTKKVGINELKNKCAHFNEWLEKLERLGSSNNQ